MAATMVVCTTLSVQLAHKACGGPKYQPTPPQHAQLAVSHPPPSGLSFFTKMLDLRHNRIKDVGVETMSCALLGQDYDDNRNRQRRALRQQQQNSPHRGAYNRTMLGGAEAMHGSGLRGTEESIPSFELRDLPPLPGTLHFVAATATATPGDRMASARVALDGNSVSWRVLKGQSAFDGLSEAALLRDSVLPATMAAANALLPQKRFRHSAGYIVARST